MPKETTNFFARGAKLASGVAAIGICAVLGAAVMPQAPLSRAAEAMPVVQTAETRSPLQMPSFADLVDRAKPAVVSVYVTQEAQQNLASDLRSPSQSNPFGEGSPFQFFFRQFGPPQGQFGPPQAQEVVPRHIQAQGSGFFISPDGYVLTNNHVIDHAKTVEIKTVSGDSYKAKVVGADAKTDLALLKVTGPKEFPYASFAPTLPRIGDWVLAMGNPFGLGGTVTAGIVSASGRDIGSGPYDDYLQIDAPVNKGNSGGPTFNLKGEVVGVNTAIYSPSGGSVGIGFAIPGPEAKKIADQLRTKGSVTRGWIGVTIQPVTRDIADSLGLKEARGAIVDEPQAGSPAAEAGIKSEDVIVAVDGQPIKDSREVARKIAADGPGSTVKLALLRNGSEQTIAVKVAAYPDERTAENDTTGKDHKLGLSLAPATADAGSRGVVVVGVDPDGAAADKGIKQGDVILRVNDRRVSEPQDVGSAIREARTQGKETVLLRLKTGQGNRFVALPIG